MCFGPFDYCTKLGPKQVKLVQLVQKFVPRRCVRIFRDKRTQSTPLDPKHMFWCVSYSLGAFGTVLLPYETNFKTVRTGQLMQKFVPRSHVGIFCNECTRSILLDPKLMFWCAFLVFGCILDSFHCCTKIGAKRIELVQLVQKFVPRGRIRIFLNECT